ncbi:glycosyltransferase family 4 protein [Kribbella sandramycini]|uniref:Glycosyltransferase family 4 protein n=1 Tax=Kribbella sandramycini TaxID=60450 RepID=A0A7Y4KWJ7_9ACTN|nr:glycosyltransferase family 4 protein [Kribbella sandramycini]MBB6568424.1 glycosyltransferase involved in cell wall biosynthesis [Kribbella sandramycini]NOL38986.1 glycosyltransferase family 4 protein [Kribbella sandramycini]
MSEIVIASLMRYAGGSGLQSHVRTFDSYLRSLGAPVQVVTPFEARSPFVLPIFAARIGIRPVSRAAAVWWHQFWHARYLKTALARWLEERPDAVIYAQCPISAGVALEVRTTQPVVMVAHFNVSQADEWADEGELPRNGRLFRSIRAFEERVLSRLDGIVYVSDYTKTGLENQVPALKVVPNAVVPNPVAPSQDRGLTTPRADLITVGRLDSRKNHRYLLDILAAAASRGHRYTLSVVGDGGDRAALEAHAAELGLADQVTFLGYRPDARRLMREHRLYCHTSKTESFGIVLVEAMAEGVPVLAAPVGGVPEVLRSGTDGLFWPLENAEAAADVLIGLMVDEPERDRMAAAAVQHAQTCFSTEAAGRQLLEFVGSARSRV